jgi:hypothetical protein
MDLKHDWKAFNSVLYPTLPKPPRSQSTGGGAELASDVVVRLAILEDEGKLVDGIVSSGKSFTDQGGATPAKSKEILDALSAKYGAQETVLFSYKDFRQAVVDGAQLGPNYFQQLALIRNRLLKTPAARAGGEAVKMVSRPHFIMAFLQSWLSRWMPRSYNFLIYIDDSVGAEEAYRALLLNVNDGRVEQFFEPDFSSLHHERLVDWAKHRDIIGDYLESRYILPCYGIFMKRSLWERCLMLSQTVLESESRNTTKRWGRRLFDSIKPWTPYIQGVRSGAAAVFPHSWGTNTLLAMGRLLMYFGRD